MKKSKRYTLFHNSKAQEFNAAILVAIIAGLIIVYMMFLPADQRKDLLDETDSGSDSSSGDIIELLKEDVGRLDPFDKIDNKDIPNVFLFETTSSQDLTTINPIRVTNGVGDHKPKTVSFSIDNLDNTDNVFLTFTASKRTGVLTIKLNDIVIYEYDINKLNVDPIKIEKKLLVGDNVMEFSVSGVGWKFWTTNEYQLENIRIIGDITDKTQQESKNIFSLTDTDYQNLESAKLQFIPYCGLNMGVGTLEVYVNSRSIYSAVPVCDDPVHQDIPIGLLSAGTNKVIFKTSKGSYSIEQIEVELESKETVSNVYYFEVNDTTCEDISDAENVKLTLQFVDEEDRKRADLNVNGHLYRIDQYDDTFERNIRDWIIEANECIENNYIKITPKDTLDIVELMVEVIE